MGFFDLLQRFFQPKAYCPPDATNPAPYLYDFGGDRLPIVPVMPYAQNLESLMDEYAVCIEPWQDNDPCIYNRYVCRDSVRVVLVNDRGRIMVFSVFIGKLYTFLQLAGVTAFRKMDEEQTKLAKEKGWALLRMQKAPFPEYQQEYSNQAHGVTTEAETQKCKQTIDSFRAS